MTFCKSAQFQKVKRKRSLGRLATLRAFGCIAAFKLPTVAAEGSAWFSTRSSAGAQAGLPVTPLTPLRLLTGRLLGSVSCGERDCGVICPQDAVVKRILFERLIPPLCLEAHIKKKKKKKTDTKPIA